MTLICSTTREFRGICSLDEPPAGMEFAPIGPPADWRAPSGGVWLLEGGVWIDTPDHRGQTWHDPATGVEVVIDAVGAPPQGYVLGSPSDPRGVALSRLAAIRYARETGGTKLPSGALVLTGREDQMMTTQALLKLERLPDGSTIEFKSPGGFVKLDLGQVRQIWQVGSDHVQRAFRAEGIVAAQIESLTNDEIGGFDVSAAFGLAWESLGSESKSPLT